MSITKNIYHDALQIGYDNLDDGISFHTMMKELKELGYTEQNFTFILWFFENFGFVTINVKVGDSEKGVHYIATQASIKSIPMNGEAFQAIHKLSGYLKADGVMRLMEFVELKEARRSSNIAMIFAIIAIVISGAIGSIQIYISNHTEESKTIETYIEENCYHHECCCQ